MRHGHFGPISIIVPNVNKVYFRDWKQEDPKTLIQVFYIIILSIYVTLTLKQSKGDISVGNKPKYGRQFL